MNNKKTAAYFCMEYGLNAKFNIYSGGLGILAGDILKAAYDLKAPMVALGILWRQGYTKQVIDENGKPMDCFSEYKYKFLKDTGITVDVNIKSDIYRLKVWLCDCLNNVNLYLLDANVEGNPNRLITGQLYGWFNEERIAQEIILGIGGIKVLRKLNINPDIYHFNDSHPMFAAFELINEYMSEDIGFSEAFNKVKNKIIFTTHTPVKAGNEVHSHELLKYMGAYNGLSQEQVSFIGGDPFNMTVAGLRLSKISNAVSKLHSKTANEMWKDVENSSQIISITNGVHNKTWQDDRIIKAFNDNKNLLNIHQKIKKEMIDEIYARNKIKLKENVLTVGFARRAAPYKRGNLIFTNMGIIEKLILDNKIQLIFSGKAHPNDLEGKKIIADFYEMSKWYPDSIIFVENYDMNIGAMLTRGCDIWLNTPKRPMEASGTSGMKAAMNGVLNFSILDGWWPEGCVHGENGWQIGDAYMGEDRNESDSESLYRVLMKEIVPTYYENQSKWEQMMKNSIEMSIYQFSAQRMVNDYYNKMYNI